MNIWFRNMWPTSPKASDGEFATFDYDAEKCHQCLLDAGFTEDEIAKGINVGTILTYPSDNSPKGKAAVVIQDALKQNGHDCKYRNQRSSSMQR